MELVIFVSYTEVCVKPWLSNKWWPLTWPAAQKYIILKFLTSRRVVNWVAPALWAAQLPTCIEIASGGRGASQLPINQCWNHTKKREVQRTQSSVTPHVHIYVCHCLLDAWHTALKKEIKRQTSHEKHTALCMWRKKKTSHLPWKRGNIGICYSGRDCKDRWCINISI